LDEQGIVRLSIDEANTWDPCVRQKLENTSAIATGPIDPNYLCKPIFPLSARAFRLYVIPEGSKMIKMLCWRHAHLFALT
jgi:hypothetical protein